MARQYFEEDETYVLMQSLFSFEDGDRFKMVDGLLTHEENGLTLKPELFKGRNRKLMMRL